MHRIILTLFISVVYFYCIGQQVSLSETNQLGKYKFYKPNSDEATLVSSFFKDNKASMGLTDYDEMILVKSEEGRNGYWHDKYKQTYKGVPVFGVSYNLHCKQEKVVSANGAYLPQINISIDHKLNGEEAIEIAQNDMKGEIYAWFESNLNQHVPSEKPAPELVIIDRALPKISGDYVLCYRLKLYSVKPLAGEEYFIDANTGQVITKLELIHDHSVPGKGKSRYYGEVDITVDSISPQKFALIDSTRGADGIKVSSFVTDIFESNSNEFDLEDEVAVDGFWCTARFYDMLKDEFDYKGLDNNDKSFNIGIRTANEDNLLNAFWNGTMAWIGNGDCNHGPLTTLEVVGHEFMHGVIDHTSELIYAFESGAINESLADVMGKMLEYRFDPDNFEWQIGHSFIINEESEPFRFLADPNKKGHPAFYEGEHWSEYNGVHTNSSIGNLWFYYLSDGAQGIHEGGQPFDVDSIGITEAAKFAFYVNRFYLTESSDYNDYYYSSMLAAEEFFNGSEQMVNNIDEAWSAVGLPTRPDIDQIYDLEVIAGERTIRACAGVGESIPLTFSVMNVGDVPYGASLDAVVETRFYNNGDWVTHLYSLDQDMLPGEQIDVTLDSIFIVTPDDLVTITHEIIFDQDKIASNNNSFSTIFINYHETNDLSVIFFNETGECFEDEFTLRGSIINESCSVVDAGLVVGLTVRNADNNELLYEDDVEITTQLETSSSYSIQDVIIQLDEAAELEIEIDYPLDNDLSNNNDYITINKLQTLDTDYINNFTSFNDLERGISLETNYIIYPLLNWSSDSYFVTTGKSVERYRPLCLESDRNWELEVFDSEHITAVIKMCVDMTDNETPELNFDLAQFRNSESFATEESSSLRVKWTDEEAIEGSTVIQGLPEGVLINQSVALPSQFKGEIEIKFLESTGTSTESNDFFNFDVSLLDNLGFNNSVNVNDEVIESDIILFPNPTGDVLSIISENIFDQIVIRDLNGRLLKRINYENRVDVSSLEKGYYLLELISDDKITVPKSFVKL